MNIHRNDFFWHAPARLCLFMALTFICLLVRPGPAEADSDSKAHKVPEDVTLGHPRVWGYQRIYPLLDGLFQDVASTQLAALSLNPNAANGASLDAVLNAFQMGVSFSQTGGVNNANMQQLNSVLNTNASVQNQLLSQQGQLIQSALAAQQQVGAAQAALDQLSPSATANDVAAAKQRLATATDNLTAVNNQLAIIKGQISSPGSLQQLLAPSTSAQQNPPTLPSGLLGLTAPPNSPTPSFPSSKQMDNQINLLWERLSRLVSTLTGADSMTGNRMNLVEVNIGITPFNRKKQLFGVQYRLRCESGMGDPQVLDLFPSASTVNIVDTKFRENRIGLAAVLSWFTVGLNASYNRDHLQMTQVLGQSAYITGYGVGKNDFGWIFGRKLGDDTITPGERTLFALVTTPATCTAFSLQATKGGMVQRQE